MLEESDDCAKMGLKLIEDKKVKGGQPQQVTVSKSGFLSSLGLWFNLIWSLSLLAWIVVTNLTNVILNESQKLQIRHRLEREVDRQPGGTGPGYEIQFIWVQWFYISKTSDSLSIESQADAWSFLCSKRSISNAHEPPQNAISRRRIKKNIWAIIVSTVNLG